jgi:hypothetical protein
MVDNVMAGEHDDTRLVDVAIACIEGSNARGSPIGARH